MIREIWQERRRFVRIDFNTSVSYQYEGRAQFDYALTKDLSEGGICLILDRFIPKDRVLMIEFSLKENILPIKTKARLAWIAQLAYVQRYRAGLEFQELSQVHKINLTRFLKNEPLIYTA